MVAMRNVLFIGQSPRFEQIERHRPERDDLIGKSSRFGSPPEQMFPG
jgi:hypothetical protein